MNMTGVSIIGWLHTYACVAALVVGAIVLIGPKGTTLHRRLGAIYIISAVIADLAVLGVYRFDIQFVPVKFGPGIFGLFHWEAMIQLVILLVAFLAASRQRRAFFAYLHPAAMLTSYYMFWGGLVNEVFVRIAPLKALAMAHLAHPVLNVALTPLVRGSQRAVMIVFAVILIGFMIQVALGRRRRSMQPA